MKRTLLIVAMLLMATPALATVTITASEDSEAVVRVSYNCDGGEEVRAFALDVSVSGTMTIDAIHDFNTGPDTGYGIFPGKFRDHIDAGDPCWSDPNYNPISANETDTTGTGLDTNKIIVEMGSLYEDPNAPPSSGTLFVLDINCNGETNGLVHLAVNDTRGGVVDEDGNSVTPDLVDANVCEEEDCYMGPDYDEWVAVDKPNCWCYPRQCYGDASGTSEGTTKTGIYWVGVPDLDIFMDAWQVKESPFGPGLQGEPNICADFSHSSEGTTKTGIYRVGIPDLDIFMSAWQVKEPPFDLGIPADCNEP